MKRLLSLTLIIAMVVLFSVPGYAQADDLTESPNQIYQRVYEECRTQTVNEITDEYSAYAYVLDNLEYIVISETIVVFEEMYSSLNEDETVVVEDFISRINVLIQEDAILVDEDFLISEKEAPTLLDTPRPMAEVLDLLAEARLHATQLKNVYDNAVFGTRHIVAGQYFAERVKTGGQWDYKDYLGTRTPYYEPELKATITGETIGNFHYGYVGSVCFEPTTLKTMAGIVQIYSGTSSPSYWTSYFDDPRDTEDIQWGIDVYNREH